MKSKVFLKIVSMVLVVVLVLVGFTSCAHGSQQDDEGNVVSSSVEYPVKLYDVEFSSSPKSVVCLSDSITEVIHVLKYEHLLVGKASNSTSKYTEDLPEVGVMEKLDYDKLEELGVDLIISEEAASSKQTYMLNEKGIKLLTFANILTFDDTKSFDDLQRLYTNLGSVFGGAKTGYEEAYEKSNDILVTIENISKLVDNTGNVTACYMFDVDGTVVTGDTLASRIMELSGLTNIAKDYTDWYMPVDEIVAKNPAYIFCPSNVKGEIISKFSGSMWAAANGHVIEMDPTLCSYYGNTLIDAITLMASTVYPDLITKSQTGTNATQTPSASQQATVSSGTSSASSTTSSSSDKVPAGTTLQKGDSGDLVYKMQQKLYALGHMYSEPTGTFDDNTEQGVMNYQYDNDYNATGIATEAMLNELFSS